MKNLTFDELTELLTQCERQLIQENSAIYIVYTKYLENNKKFINDTIRILRESELFTNISAAHGCDYPSPVPSLSELMLYAYLLPFEKHSSGDEVPDFFDDDVWEGFYYNKARRRKYYYTDRIKEDDTGTYCSNVNINHYVHDNILQLRMFFQKATEEELVEAVVAKISEWKASMKEGEFFGSPLCEFPLVSELTTASQRILFLIDLGCYIYKLLPDLRMLDEDAPLIIPQDFISNQIISFTKSMVQPEIDYNASEERVEIKSNTCHTVFDVISLANELSDITDVEEQEKIISTAISEIKKENTTFPNVTVRDLSALSNIISMFITKDPDSVTLDTTLGELSDGIMKGLSNYYHDYRFRKEFICEALSILHKWSAYNFNLGAKGSVTPFNYVADEFASSPAALRKGILGIADKPSYRISDKNANTNADRTSLQSLSDMSVKQLEQMPVRIEMSVFLKEIIEHNQMSKQFSANYQKLKSPNTQAIYAYIEMKRKEKKYPLSLNISYTELASNFVVERKVRFVNIVKQCLNELLTVGALKDYIFYDSTTAWKLEFEKIL